MIGTTANLLGNLLGFFLPGLFIKPKYDRFQIYTEEQYATFRRQIYNLMLALSIFGSVILLLVIFTFREKPSKPLPGSIIQTDPPSQLTFLEQLKKLKSRSYWLAAVSSSLTISLYYTFSTVVGQLVHVHH
jgi:Na+/melibiose symporter-like transporter